MSDLNVGAAVVEERCNVKPGQLTESLLASDQPIVLRRFASEWPAVIEGKKSPEAAAEYLTGFYSGEPLTISRGDAESDGRIFYNQDFTGFNHTNALEDFSLFLAELVERSESDAAAALYMPSTDIRRWFPNFDADNSAEIDFLNPIKFLWAGNQTRIAAHYDFLDNFAVCITGRRRFTLFPPEQITNLYPGPLGFAPGGQEISLVDFSAPDFEKFPKFKKALEAAFTTVLEPGDALFLPGMWWHHVEGLDALNVLYTQWWRNSPRYLGRPTNALMHALLSIRSLPQSQKSAWKALFDHYVFDCQEEDIAEIPEHARASLSLPLSDTEARKLRAELINRLKVG